MATIERGADALAYAGPLLVSAGGRTLSVWSDARLAREAECGRHNLHALAVSPDGGLVAMGGDEDAVRVCDVATLRETAVLEAGGGIGSLDWAGERLYIATRDGRALLWSPPAAEAELLLEDVDGLAVSGALVIAARGKEILVEERRLATGFAFPISVIAASARHVAAGSQDGEVAVWEIAGARKLWAGAVHDDPVEAIAFTADGRTLAAGNEAEGPSRDNVALWDVETGRGLRRWRAHGGWFNDLAFRPDRKRLATCSGTDIVLWDL